MKITEVKITLNENQNNPQLIGFVSITLDNEFAIRDIKLINGKKGVFVAMPNRSRMESCPDCNRRNSVKASYCNWCGFWLGDPPELNFQDVYEDTAFPIHAKAREYITSVIMAEYNKLKPTNNQTPDLVKPNTLSYLDIVTRHEG